MTEFKWKQVSVDIPLPPRGPITGVPCISCGDSRGVIRKIKGSEEAVCPDCSRWIRDEFWLKMWRTFAYGRWE